MSSLDINASQESSLKGYLSDLCSEVFDVSVGDTDISVSVSGTLNNDDRFALLTGIQDEFPHLAGKKIHILDDHDRLDISDTERRGVERQVKKKTTELLSTRVEDFRLLPEELIGSLRVRWRILAKIARFFGYDAQSKVIKMRIDSGVVYDHNVLDGLVQELEATFGIPVRVMNMSFAEMVREEREVETARSH